MWKYYREILARRDDARLILVTMIRLGFFKTSASQGGLYCKQGADVWRVKATCRTKPTCDDSVFLHRLLPANSQRCVEDFSKAQTPYRAWNWGAHTQTHTRNGKNVTKFSLPNAAFWHITLHCWLSIATTTDELIKLPSLVKLWMHLCTLWNVEACWHYISGTMHLIKVTF